LDRPAAGSRLPTPFWSKIDHAFRHSHFWARRGVQRSGDLRLKAAAHLKLRSAKLTHAKIARGLIHRFTRTLGKPPAFRAPI
jgi:hypothetical protein